jgi:hypothetical protein
MRSLASAPAPVPIVKDALDTGLSQLAKGEMVAGTWMSYDDTQLMSIFSRLPIPGEDQFPRATRGETLASVRRFQIPCPRVRLEPCVPLGHRISDRQLALSRVLVAGSSTSTTHILALEQTGVTTVAVDPQFPLPPLARSAYARARQDLLAAPARAAVIAEQSREARQSHGDDGDWDDGKRAPASMDARRSDWRQGRGDVYTSATARRRRESAAASHDDVDEDEDEDEWRMLATPLSGAAPRRHWD